MPKTKPAETFGAFHIYHDGRVTTLDGRRPLAVLAEQLRETDQTIEEDFDVLEAFSRDFARAKLRAGTYASSPGFRPLPLAMSFLPAFQPMPTAAKRRAA